VDVEWSLLLFFCCTLDSAWAASNDCWKIFCSSDQNRARYKQKNNHHVVAIQLPTQPTSSAEHFNARELSATLAALHSRTWIRSSDASDRMWKPRVGML
jgi:hypothetical protein